MDFFKKKSTKLLHNYNDLKVFALVGSSGSGKSYSVDILVKKYKIDLIIDDGLLIKDNKILAGISAKQEKSEMMAVKRAVFFEHKHRYSVIRQLDRQYSPRILILGTSVKMINRICSNLFLPLPSKIIMIEQIRSKEEIDYSHRMRDKQGKHIIPLPYIELKKYINELDDKVLIDEAFLNKKTLVSPKFSRNMTVAFSNREVEIIIAGIIQQKWENLEVKKIDKRNFNDQTYLKVFVKNDINADIEYDLEEIRKFVNKRIVVRLEDLVVESIEKL